MNNSLVKEENPAPMFLGSIIVLGVFLRQFKFLRHTIHTYECFPTEKVFFDRII